MLPRALRVKTQASLSDGKTLDKDEVLLVRKMGKSMLRKPFLKVYSAAKREDKTLYVSPGQEVGVACLIGKILVELFTCVCV